MVSNPCLVGPKRIIQMICDRIATRAGYPKRGVRAHDGSDAGNEGITTLLVDFRLHPADATKAALDIPSIAKAHLAAIRAAIRAKVQSGTADMDEQAADILPDEVHLTTDWIPPRQG